MGTNGRPVYLTVPQENTGGSVPVPTHRAAGRQQSRLRKDRGHSLCLDQFTGLVQVIVDNGVGRDSKSVID